MTEQSSVDSPVSDVNLPCKLYLMAELNLKHISFEDSGLLSQCPYLVTAEYAHGYWLMFPPRGVTWAELAKRLAADGYSEGLTKLLSLVRQLRLKYLHLHLEGPTFPTKPFNLRISCGRGPGGLAELEMWVLHQATLLQQDPKLGSLKEPPSDRWTAICDRSYQGWTLARERNEYFRVFASEGLNFYEW